MVELLGSCDTVISFKNLRDISMMDRKSIEQKIAQIMRPNPVLFGVRS